MTTPLEQTEKRISDAARENYAAYALAKRKPRSFRYSDRRLYRSMKYWAVSAKEKTPLYCAFLGPSGVTLAAPEKDTIPVLTYIRYPVAYRRRMRFLKDWALSNGVLEQYTDDDGVVHPIGEDMTVFYCTNKSEAYIYVGFVSNKDACVTAAKSTPAEDDEEGKLKKEIAILCCNANGWKYTD